ncbi:cupin domain-containing protein, partial [Micromonospora sp. DH15]|nr:cupin domain-containing protein [Micromonospora sp. DH15]
PAPPERQPWGGRADEVSATAQGPAALDVVLEPGDALYLPRGWLHSAQAQETSSLHLTVGIRALTRYASVEELLALAAADARWNLGIAAGQRGDTVGALRCFAEVEREYRRLAVPRPALLLDRFELLLSVPLLDEAVEVAAVAVRELNRRGMASDLAEALLARARAALLAGDLDTAT